MAADQLLVQGLVARFRQYKDLAERAMAQVGDDGFFDTPYEDGNSVAVIVKHLAGNMRSRWTDFLHSDGEKPDRHRDTEFELDAADTRDVLMLRWEQGWQLVFDALTAIADDDLGRTVYIRGEAHSVWEATLRQLGHYAYHAGQIVLLARSHCGANWVSLSIPRGESRAYNASLRSR